MVISNSTFKITTDHGQIVYSLQPQHLNDVPGTTLRDRCVMFGHQLAVCNAGQWYMPGMKEKITDARTVALLERVSDA